jgi:hypothetical protein
MNPRAGEREQKDAGSNPDLSNSTLSKWLFLPQG